MNPDEFLTRLRSLAVQADQGGAPSLAAGMRELADALDTDDVRIVEDREIARFRMPADWGDVERMVNAVYHGAGDEWSGYDTVSGEFETSIDGDYLVVTWKPASPPS